MSMIKMLAASLCLAVVGLMPVGASPASAASLPTCAEQSSMQFARVSWGVMGSCFVSLHNVYGGVVFKVRTAMVSVIPILRVHGCVKVQLFNASGQLTGESQARRFGLVGGFDSDGPRQITIEWADEINEFGAWAEARFHQYTC